MANEELFKRMGDAAKRAAEGGQGGGGKKPPETPSTSDQPESPKNENESSSKREVKPVEKERIEAMAAKLQESLPETAKRIVSGEGDLPKDERVFSVIEQLMNADESQLNNVDYMRAMGQRLVAIAQEAEFDSPAAAEARKYLSRIAAEHPALEDLRMQAIPVAAQAVPETVPESELGKDITATEKDPELSAEVRRLYNEDRDLELKDTPIAQDLRDLQYRFRVDPGAAYDSRLTDQAVKTIVDKGRREGVDEKLVQQAVERVRYFEQFTDLRLQKRQEKLRGGSIS